MFASSRQVYPVWRKQPPIVSCLNTWIHSVSSHPAILGCIQSFHLPRSCQVIISFGLSRLKTYVHESCLFDLTALTTSVQELTCDAYIPPTDFPYLPYIYFFCTSPTLYSFQHVVHTIFFLFQCEQLTVAKKCTNTHTHTHTHRSGRTDGKAL